jgi:DNA-binding IclR family transcriptional regulator
VLDKAVEILAALERGPRSLAELTETTGLPRATCHRLAVALERHGLIRRDGAGRFCLGLRLATWGRVASAGVDLRAAARPALEALRTVTGESVQLYVRDGDARICVLSLESPNELRTIVAEGARLPLDRGSAGAVLTDGWSGPWAQSVGERQAGVASVSAPVSGPDGGVLAAVSVSGPIERLGRTPGARWGDDVAAAARAVEAALG